MSVSIYTYLPLRKHAHVFKVVKKKMKIFSRKKKYFSYLCSKQIVGEAVLTRNHNLCFVAKIRKIGIPQFYYIRWGIRRFLFHIEKLGFVGVFIIFLFLIQNIHCGFSLKRF